MRPIGALKKSSNLITDVYKVGFTNGRIYGGTNANDGEFPFVISVRYINVINFGHVCGGSILSERRVLSAAHCRTELPSGGRYNLIAGLTNFGRTQSQQISANPTWVTHPDYKGGVNPYDIMIFNLVEPFTWNERVQPIAIPEVLNQSPTGGVVLIGWGQIEGGSSPQDLKKADKRIEPLQECKANLESLVGPSPLDDREDGANICSSGSTRAEDPLSACSGDSGGPLFDNSDPARPVQVGIVSWGITPCGTPRAPSVYTKVSHFVDWLKQNL